jgi:hypothetical protein
MRLEPATLQAILRGLDPFVQTQDARLIPFSDKHFQRWLNCADGARLVYFH